VYISSKLKCPTSVLLSAKIFGDNRNMFKNNLPIELQELLKHVGWAFQQIAQAARCAPNEKQE